MRLGRLDFEQPDLARCLALAFAALRAGQGACVALNAANEVAVEAFLSGRLAYTWIPASSRRRWSGRRGRLLLRSAVSRMCWRWMRRRAVTRATWGWPEAPRAPALSGVSRLAIVGLSPAYRSWILDPDAFHPARLCGCARLLIIFTSWATISRAPVRREGPAVFRGFWQVVLRRTDRHGTEWAVSALPLGGYVKMQDDPPPGASPSEIASAFNTQPVGKRIAIVAAGPIFNLILAVLLYAALNLAGTQEPAAILAKPAVDTPAAVPGCWKGTASCPSAARKSFPGRTRAGG